LNAHKTFAEPQNVSIKEFKGFKIVGRRLEIIKPPLSVVMMAIAGKLELVH